MAENRVVIVGGGVIGLSVGWQLARSGREVTLLERDSYERSASWMSAGMLTPLAEVRHQEEALLSLAQHSLSLFPQFVEELQAESGIDVDYRQDGVLLVGITRDDVEHLKFRYEFQKSLGLGVEWLSGDAAREREPHLSTHITSGVWCPGDQQVDNRLLMQALKVAFEKSGGAYVTDSEVTAIDIENSRVSGVTVNGKKIPAGSVILAAGAWSSKIDSLERGFRPPVRPVKGQILRLRMSDQVTLGTIVWYSRHESSSVIYLAPKASGELVLGATSEEMGYDLEPTAGGLFDLLRGAWEAVPGVYEMPIAEVGVGLRPGSRDDAPVLGPTSVEGLIMATCHFRKGILLSAVTASSITEMMGTGEVPSVIRPFGIERFQ